MSSSEDDQGGAGRREVAYRMFAAEYDDADFSYSESDEERAPNYVVTPSGARVNRLFVVGVLTEVEQVNDNVLRARVVDPTGAFVAYAGQYQPDELAFLQRADPPTFVALTGKARTFQPDDSETVYTSVRPETINEVTAETRDRWVVATAEQTLGRVATMADALGREERGDTLRDALTAEGVDEGLAAGVAMAIEHYGTTPSYLAALRETALDAARVVAGDRDEAGALTIAPDEEGATSLPDIRAMDPPLGESSVESTGGADPASTAASTGTETGPTDETVTTGASAAEATDATEGTTGTDVDSEAAEPAETETAPTGDATEAEPITADAEATAGTEPKSTPGTDADDAGAQPATTEPAASVDTTPTDDEDTVVGEDNDIGDFEGGEFELEEETREEIEAEYGTDFSTGNEVEEPGEADIDTPDPEDTPVEDEPEATPAEPATGAASTEAEPETKAEDEDEVEPGPEPGNEDVDLADAVMDAMRDRDDGDGAVRTAVVEAVVDRTGAGEDDVEDAIQDTLMDGRCYEPDEETLKPI